MKRALVASCIVAVILAMGVTPAAAKKGLIAQYLANALAADDPEGGRSSELHINIYQWSSDDDLDVITDAIEEASANRRAYRAVPDALRSLGKAGYMFLPGGQGWPIRYARERQVDGKTQIVLASDRPVTFTEIYRGSAIRDFDITLINLDFDDSSTGEGIVSVGTEVIWDETENRLKITNYSPQPVHLGDVRPVE
jgi:hypothetical protein